MFAHFQKKEVKLGLFNKKRKSHKCPNCKEKFREFKSVRSVLKNDGKMIRIFIIDDCPYCTHIFSHGIFTLPSSEFNHLIA